MRAAAALVLAALAAFLPAAADARRAATPRPIVTVVRHGGLCLPGRECEAFFRITDTRIAGTGFEARRLRPAERRALLRAIRELDPAYLRAHPFRGICPTAWDGQESVYRFRDFRPALASCTYDLRGVKAVRLVDRLLASLAPL